MSFFAISFLWSLALVSLPILIALWNRRRRRQVKFGGFYLLNKVFETTKRRFQILQLLKLINRIILISLIVFILAEPRRSKSVLKEAADGFSIFLDVGRVMQAKFGNESLVSLQKKMLVEVLQKMPPAARGLILFVSSECRSLRMPDGRLTANAADWIDALGEITIPYGIQPTNSNGVSACLARAEGMFAGKSSYTAFISPLPATLDVEILKRANIDVYKLPEPDVKFVERPELREEVDSQRTRLLGFDGRKVTLLRPPERPVLLGDVAGDLELPLNEQSWLLIEKPQVQDPWEGSSIRSLQFQPQREIVLWTAKETEGYQSLLTALRAHPRLKVIRQQGGLASGGLVILYGGYTESLESLKKVWLFQSAEQASPFAIRDQKQWSTTEAFSDLRRSFEIRTDSGAVFVKRYVLFEGDLFDTLETFEDGAPALMQMKSAAQSIWVTPFDLEDLTTDLALEPTFIPYLYKKLDQWLDGDIDKEEGGVVTPLWLMSGTTKPSEEVIKDQLWPGIYQVGSGTGGVQFKTVEAGPFPLQFLPAPTKTKVDEMIEEFQSLRPLLLKLLMLSILLELSLGFLSAILGKFAPTRWTWLGSMALVISMFVSPDLLAEVRERVPVGYLEGTQADRVDALKQLVRDSVHLSNLEMAAPEVAKPSDFWKYAIVFSAGGSVPIWNDSDRSRLREFFEKGGLLVFDDPLATAQSSFRRAVEEQLAKLFPGRSLEAISNEDVIFRTFYLLSEVSGRKLTSPTLEGIKIDSRWVVLFSTNDLLGATLRSASGDYQLSVSPYGVMQRTLSQRLLVNFLFYSLTVDYKDDAIHLPHILKRRAK